MTKLTKTMLIVSLLSLFMSPVLPARAGHHPEGGGHGIVHVSVLGLVCEFCVQTIEKTLMKTGKVDAVDVDLDKGLVTITLQPGQDLDDETIGGAIKSAGYAVEKIHHMPAEAAHDAGHQ